MQASEELAGVAQRSLPAAQVGKRSLAPLAGMAALGGALAAGAGLPAGMLVGGLYVNTASMLVRAAIANLRCTRIFSVRAPG